MPKVFRRLRWSRATRFCWILLLPVYLIGAQIVRADGGAVPIVSTKVPRVAVGTPVKAAIGVNGGSAPYTFEVIAGALPTGLGLAGNGAISGTPTQSGPFNFTVRVTDSGSLKASAVQSYVMVVQDRDPALDPDTIALLNQQASTARRFALAQIGNFHTRLQTLRAARAGRCAVDGGGPALAAPPAPVTARGDAGLLAQPPQQAETFSLPLDHCRTLADRSTTMWSAGALNVGATRGEAGASGFRFDSQGITLGGDFGLRPNLSVGVGVGFGGEESFVVPVNGTGSGTYGTSVAGYVSYRPVDRVYLEAVFGGGAAAMESTRIAANGGEAYGARRAEQRFVSFSAGHRFGNTDWQVLPYTRVDHVNATLRSVTEYGAGTDALILSEERVPSLKLVAGASAETSFSTWLGTIAPRTSLEYRRELERADPAYLRYADDPNGPNYSVLPGTMERDSTTLGLGANLHLASRWSFGFGASLNRSNTTSSSRIDARLNKVF